MISSKDDDELSLDVILPNSQGEEEKDFEAIDQNSDEDCLEVQIQSWL